MKGEIPRTEEGSIGEARLLVVDDDPEVREALCDVLVDEGYQVIRAENGAEAIIKLTTEKAPNLIILDLTMPVLDGHGFLDARAADLALFRIPVIVVSATIDERVRQHRVLTARKPIDLDALLLQIRRTISGPKSPVPSSG